MMALRNKHHGEVMMWCPEGDYSVTKCGWRETHLHALCNNLLYFSKLVYRLRTHVVIRVCFTQVSHSRIDPLAYCTREVRPGSEATATCLSSQRDRVTL